MWLCREPQDFRKQLTGLIQVVAAKMDKQPNNGSLYVFCNKKKDKLKLVLWERNGFFLGYKVLEKGTFHFPKEHEGQIRLNWEQMLCLISGWPMSEKRINKSGQYFF